MPKYILWYIDVKTDVSHTFSHLFERKPYGVHILRDRFLGGRAPQPQFSKIGKLGLGGHLA